MAISPELLLIVVPGVLLAYLLENLAVWWLYPALHTGGASAGEMEKLVPQVRDRQGESITLLGIILAVTAFVIESRSEMLHILPVLMAGIVLLLLSLAASYYYPQYRIAANFQTTGNRYALAMLILGLLGLFLLRVSAMRVSETLMSSLYLLNVLIVLILLLIGLSDFYRNYQSDPVGYFLTLDDAVKTRIADEHIGELMNNFNQKTWNKKGVYVLVNRQQKSESQYEYIFYRERAREHLNGSEQELLDRPPIDSSVKKGYTVLRKLLRDSPLSGLSESVRRHCAWQRYLKTALPQDLLMLLELRQKRQE